VDSQTAISPAGLVNINGQFDGAPHGHFFRKKYYNPTPAAKARRVPALGDVEPLNSHRDILRRKIERPLDLERGIDPFDGKLRRIVIQAGGQQYNAEQGPWRRRRIKSNASWRLRFSGWLLGPGAFDEDYQPNGGEIFARVVKILFTSYPLPFMALASFPSQDIVTTYYRGVPARSWEYPKHVRNLLDADPQDTGERKWLVKEKLKEKLVTYKSHRDQARMLRPRVLMVKGQKGYKPVVQEDRIDPEPYIFISYANVQHEELTAEEAEQMIHAAAAKLAEQENVRAYWLDFACRADEQPELSDDIHRLADCIRGAKTVWALLPSLDNASFAAWGSRMWTLAEALLAPGHHVMVYSRSNGDKRKLSLTDLPKLAWVHYSTPSYNYTLTEDKEESLEDFRLLAEHFTGTLSLSRIELTSVALRAMRSRKFRTFEQGDLAYSLMALLQYRPAMDPSDSEFQALARLSLSNDSDRIVERMVCLLPPFGQEGLFTTEDRLQSKLHEIEPLTQVAGVCYDDGLMLDGCRGITIHWDNFPRVRYVTRNTPKKRWSRRAMRVVFFTWIIGIILASFRQTAGAGAVFIIISLIITFTSPWLMANVFGGKVWGMEPWLIGFEGTMPIQQIETKLFGNCIGRLLYAPSSSEFSQREPYEHIGAQPAFSTLPPGHTMFTLVDTGSMTVTLFSARLPPSVALICGKEGGMLRTLLCSYDIRSRAYIKQSVIRMETPTLDQSHLMGWIKVKG